jgi:hypothetical protein
MYARLGVGVFVVAQVPAGSTASTAAAGRLVLLEYVKGGSDT